MSAPSAHPNCCARHPSLSSPICVFPEPTFIHFPNTVMFSPQKKFTRVETGENFVTMFRDTYIESSLGYFSKSNFFPAVSHYLSLDDGSFSLLFSS